MGCSASRETVANSAGRSALVNFFDEHALGTKLGRGSFAQVRIATKLTPGIDKGDMAVKIVDLRDKQEPDKTDYLLMNLAHTEAAAWASAKDHDNVVRLHEVFFDESCCYFLMERCTMSLFAHLESMPELNERSLVGTFAQMFDGISHMHSVRVVHRDVKPDNFLVNGTTVKLSDFGLSAILPKDGKVKGIAGTAPFMCPEMLQEQFYDDRADVWSMAVLVYCFFFGEFPYVPEVRRAKKMKQAIVSGLSPSFKPVAPCLGMVLSQSAIDFVHALLERTPDQRPSARDALEMQFFVGGVGNQPLPSLRPLIYAARKAGAFELRNPTKTADIDSLLSKKQQDKHGLSLPDRALCAKSVLGKNDKPLDPRIVLRETSKNWQVANSGNSFNSNIWENTSSCATTSSGNSSLQGLSSPCESFAPSPTPTESLGPIQFSP